MFRNPKYGLPAHSAREKAPYDKGLSFLAKTA
jgi:hypothetical protein